VVFEEDIVLSIGKNINFTEDIIMEENLPLHVSIINQYSERLIINTLLDITSNLKTRFLGNLSTYKIVIGRYTVRVQNYISKYKK